jgi:HEAT repeat protein
MRQFVLPLAFLSFLATAPRSVAAQVTPEKTYQGRTFRQWANALRSADPRARLAAAVALKEAGDNRRAAVAVLAPLVLDPLPAIRAAAVLSLAHLCQEDEDLVTALTPALLDAFPEIREQAARAIAHASGRVFPALLKGMKDPLPRLRSQSTLAFGELVLILFPVFEDEFVSHQIVPALERAFRDEHPAVRRAAVLVLARVHGMVWQVTPLLLEALRTETDVEIRRAVVEGMQSPSYRHLAEEQAALIACFRDPILGVRLTALNSLAAIIEGYYRHEEEVGETKQLLGLIGGLRAARDNPDVRIRAGIIECLKQMMGRRSTELLGEFLTDTDGRVRIAAAQALAKRGEYAVPVLVRILRTKVGTQRLLAAAVLGEIGAEAKEAVGPLLEVAGQDEAETRNVALQALGKIRSQRPE